MMGKGFKDSRFGNNVNSNTHNNGRYVWPRWLNHFHRSVRSAHKCGRKTKRLFVMNVMLIVVAKSATVGLSTTRGAFAANATHLGANLAEALLFVMSVRRCIVKSVLS
jgi:hypothetical protein